MRTSYVVGNVGSATLQELWDWVEYCKSAVKTTLARERAANGSPEPFGVKLWGVGNENWGCGGNYDAVTYVHEYRRYAAVPGPRDRRAAPMLRHVDPTAELIVCGLEDPPTVDSRQSDWNEKVLGALGKHINLV